MSTVEKLRQQLSEKADNKLSKEELEIKNLVNVIVHNTIETPIATIIERTKEVPEKDIIEKINALKVELVKLQYRLREYAIADWYQNELDDLRKHLHDVFERNREFFKAGSKGENWLALSTGIPSHTKGFEEFKGSSELDNKGPYYFRYFNDSNQMAVIIDRMRKRDTNKLLCVPLFKAG